MGASGVLIIDDEGIKNAQAWDMWILAAMDQYLYMDSYTVQAISSTQMDIYCDKDYLFSTSKFYLSHLVKFHLLFWFGMSLIFNFPIGFLLFYLISIGFVWNV